MVIARYPRSIRFSPEVEEALVDVSEEHGTTITDVVERACRYYLTEKLDVDLPPIP